MYRNVYSDFEIKEMHIKFGTENSYLDMNCVGSSSEKLEVKTITKKCRGAVQRQKTKGTGNGELKVSAHVPVDIYNMMYDMNRPNLIEGVKAFGQNSSLPEFSITQKVLDEDDEVKLKAYPRCVLAAGPERAIENGATEVPELELTITLLPDDKGECMYEAIEKDLKDEEVKTKWLTGFTPSMVVSEEETE